MNHPNRRRRPPGVKPQAGEIPLSHQVKDRRAAAGLTQEQAAGLVYAAIRTWEDWEQGKTPMRPAQWELFCLKTERLIRYRGEA